MHPGEIVRPVIGQWYYDRTNDREFEILNIDKEEGILELQYLEGEVTKLPPTAVNQPESNTIGIWQNGGIVKYRFEDPLFVKAFTGMETVALPAFPLFANPISLYTSSKLIGKSFVG